MRKILKGGCEKKEGAYSLPIMVSPKTLNCWLMTHPYLLLFTKASDLKD